MKFTIPGEPQGKARPRVVRNGNFTRAYTPEKTASYENLVRLEYQRQCGSRFYDKEIPLAVTITAHFAPPASASKRKLAAMLDKLLFPMKKPDLDNVAKIVCDALNGIAYHDDAQIVALHVRKLYAVMPKVDVEISEVIG